MDPHIPPSYIFANKNDLHKVLGLQKAATDVEVKRAYRRLALRYHPDKYERGASHSEAEHLEAFRIICKAHEVLTDPNKRRIYELGGMQKVEETELRGDVHMPSFREAIQMISLVCLVFVTREGFRNIKRSGNAKGEGDVPIGDADARRRSRNMFKEEMQFPYTVLHNAYKRVSLILALVAIAVLIASCMSSVMACEDSFVSCTVTAFFRTFVGGTMKTKTKQARAREALSFATLSSKRTIVSESTPSLYCSVSRSPEEIIIYTYEQPVWMVASSPQIDLREVAHPTINTAIGTYNANATDISLLEVTQCGFSYGPYLSSKGIPFYSKQFLSASEVSKVSIDDSRVMWVGDKYCSRHEIPAVEASFRRSQSDQYCRRWEPEVKVCKDEQCRQMRRKPIRLRRLPLTVPNESHLHVLSPFCKWWQSHRIPTAF